MRKKLNWILAVLPFVWIIPSLFLLPNQIPVHFGIDGAVNRWGSKYELFLSPAIGLLLTAIIYATIPIAKKGLKSNSPYVHGSEGDLKRLELINTIILVILDVVALAVLIIQYRLS